jgi:predicted SAM-dependent methyltransferase
MLGVDFSQTKISLGRSIWSYSKVQAIVAALIRGRKVFMDRKSEGLILNVGCGPNSNPSNINMDYDWHPGIDICCDITKGLPLEDNYVGGVFTEHCIEHITFDAALFLFREFYRIMRPGTYARIIVPDFELYVERVQSISSDGSTFNALYARRRKRRWTLLTSDEC